MLDMHAFKFIWLCFFSCADKKNEEVVFWLAWRHSEMCLILIRAEGKQHVMVVL